MEWGKSGGNSLRFDNRLDPLLDEISQKIINCKKCDLAESRINAVPGEGPQHAKMILIGEGPGQKEDDTGRPFIGQSGKFLSELLERNGIHREDVFITSVVKCRPPDNRVPTMEEIKSCLPYLLSQIDSIAPVVIVTLGNTAYQVFSFTFYLPKKKIGEVRGKLFHLHSTAAKILIPTYHPAGLLYNRKLIPDFEEDIKKAVDQLSQYR